MVTLLKFEETLVVVEGTGRPDNLPALATTMTSIPTKDYGKYDHKRVDCWTSEGKEKDPIRLDLLL